VNVPSVEFKYIDLLSPKDCMNQFSRARTMTRKKTLRQKEKSLEERKNERKAEKKLTNYEETK